MKTLNSQIPVEPSLSSSSDLREFIASLKLIAAEETDEGILVERLRPFAERLADCDELAALPVPEPDPEQGFGFRLLYEEPDHSLVVALLSWLPGRGTPPHDHGTWGVVVGISGEEVNTFWKRLDDGSRQEYAEVGKEGERTFGPGESLTLLPRTIHSIENRTDALSLSLHVYGRHINHTDRRQFDADRRTATPWKVRES